MNNKVKRIKNNNYDNKVIIENHKLILENRVLGNKVN